MSNLYKIVEQIQKDLYCPVCGKKFNVGEIRIKGIFNHTIIIQSICDEGHITLFMTKIHGNIKDNQPITKIDISNLHKELIDFDGDFEKQWSS